MDLHRTLRFCVPATPRLFRGRGQSAEYTLRTESGPAAVFLACEDGVLNATVAGPGAAAAVAVIPRTVGADDPAELGAAVGLVRDLDRRFGGFRLGSSGRVFDSILPSVLGQRVTTDEAKKNYSRLVAAVGERAPGDADLLLPPLPEAVAALSFGDLHRLGIEQARARVVLEVAARAHRLEEITQMSREAAEARLMAIRGVGPWTAAQVMGAAWGDRDAIPIGDYHLPNTVAWALAGEPRANDERMLELLEPYRPQRRRAVLLIKMSGINAPRYGPRNPQSIISRGGSY